MKREDVSSSRAKDQPCGQVAPGGEQATGMVERVARALCWRNTLASTCYPEPNETDVAYIDCSWPRYAGAARTAIAAMREAPPNPDVPECLPWDMHNCASRDEHGNPCVTRSDWSSLIDAALSEPQ